MTTDKLQRYLDQIKDKTTDNGIDNINKKGQSFFKCCGGDDPQVQRKITIEMQPKQKIAKKPYESPQQTKYKHVEPSPNKKVSQSQYIPQKIPRSKSWINNKPPVGYPNIVQPQPPIYSPFALSINRMNTHYPQMNNRINGPIIPRIFNGNPTFTNNFNRVNTPLVLSNSRVQNLSHQPYRYPTSYIPQIHQIPTVDHRNYQYPTHHTYGNKVNNNLMQPIYHQNLSSQTINRQNGLDKQ